MKSRTLLLALVIGFMGVSCQIQAKVPGAMSAEKEAVAACVMQAPT
ncbi:hypothetical protein [Pseudomonas panipatensis]